MVLKLYNTMTKEKEVFKPLEEGKVWMYVCSVTPYDFSHIGHARAYVAFDAFQGVELIFHLSLLEGKVFRDLYIDVLVVGSDGNLLDALSAAVKHSAK